MQPLDLSINRQIKDEFRGHFIDWYADKISNAVGDAGPDADLLEIVQPDFRMSVIKPIQASWLVKTFATVFSLREMI